MPITFRCECGKLFVTADANAGRRMVCTQCGRDIGVPGSTEVREEIVFLDPTPARTSRKAIASLVLGLLSFVFFLFAGAPAVILGWIALTDIDREPGRIEGKVMARWGITLGCLGSLILLFLPAISHSPEAARRSQCVNNLKQIGLALHNYHSDYGSFPPQASRDANGKALLSWRVAILPYLEQPVLYRQFRLDEPWDSPHNSRLAKQIPMSYVCPSDRTAPGAATRYQAIVGPRALFKPDGATSMGEVTDGTSNTLAVVEAKVAVPWSKPSDVDFDLIEIALGSDHPGGGNVLLTDGHVRFLKKTTPPATLRALATRAGGEVWSEENY